MLQTAVKQGFGSWLFSVWYFSAASWNLLYAQWSYEEKEIVLEKGESVLFYSDGLVEAHDPKGEMFGFPRLRALIAKHGEERSLVDSLLEELYSFTGEGWEQEDDITLVTLRRYAFVS